MTNPFFYFQTRTLGHGRSTSKSDERGFTIIEILVVVVVLGILSTMAIPSLFAFTNRARESEARSYVSTINKGQQAYYLKYGLFGNLANLSVGIDPSTKSYTYTSVADNVNGIADTIATPTATMRGFAGRVWIGGAGGGADMYAILCEGPSGLPPAILGTTCP